MEKLLTQNIGTDTERVVIVLEVVVAALFKRGEEDDADKNCNCVRTLNIANYNDRRSQYVCVCLFVGVSP